MATSKELTVLGRTTIEMYDSDPDWWDRNFPIEMVAVIKDIKKAEAER